MRVYDQNSNGAVAAQAGGAQDIQRAARGDSSRTEAVPGPGDRVELSRDLGALSSAIHADADARAGRVNTLAAQFDRGVYHPDSAATSRAIVAESLAAIR
jgi:hypothetical protein